MLMKCPNCGKDVYTRNFCSSCGIDIVLFQKVINLSNVLYNKGLFAAGNNDLSGAYEALSKSIKINKDNYIARNILGLVCLEMGLLGDALKQWVISSSLVREDNVATDYINAISDKGRTMEKLNDAVSMYNQALVYLNQNSEDMAIIQLKKAIEINPKFIAAYNLLSLIYISLNEHDKAGSLIEKVLAMDFNNKFALYYFKQLNPNKARPVVKETKAVKQENASRPRHTKVPAFQAASKRSLFPYAEIISFIIGAVCVAAVFYILIIPGTVGEKDTQISAITNEYADKESAYKNQIAEKDNSIAALEEEIRVATIKNEELAAQQEIQRRIQQFQEIVTISHDDDRLEEAAGLLDTIDITNFPDEVREQHSSLKSNVYAKLAENFYNSGRNSYNRGRYDDSKADLEKSLKYITGEDFIDDALYYLGRIAVFDRDNDQARMYFERIVNDYADSNQFNNARSRLNALP